MRLNLSISSVRWHTLKGRVGLLPKVKYYYDSLSFVLICLSSIWRRTMFVWISRSKSSTIVQTSYGACTMSPTPCSGDVDLVQSKTKTKLFGVIPLNPVEEQEARCQQCRRSIRAVHYDAQRQQN